MFHHNHHSHISLTCKKLCSIKPCTLPPHHLHVVLHHGHPLSHITMHCHIPPITCMLCSIMAVCVISFCLVSSSIASKCCRDVLRKSRSRAKSCTLHATAWEGGGG